MLLRAVPVALVAALLSSCGTEVATQAASEPTAEPCWYGDIRDHVPDASGPPTPAEALVAEADFVEARLARESETVPDTPERRKRHAEDRLSIEALRALAEVAEDEPAGRDFEVLDEEGNRTAAVDLRDAPRGGVLIESLSYQRPPEDCAVDEERFERESSKGS